MRSDRRFMPNEIEKQIEKLVLQLRTKEKLMARYIDNLLKVYKEGPRTDNFTGADLDFSLLLRIQSEIDFILELKGEIKRLTKENQLNKGEFEYDFEDDVYDFSKFL